MNSEHSYDFAVGLGMLVTGLVVIAIIGGIIILICDKIIEYKLKNRKER